MAKFAFIVPPLMGHINPTLSLGAELINRGHEVGWVSIDESLGSKLPKGGQLLLIEYDKSDATQKSNQEYLNLISKQNVYGIESIKFLYEDVLIPLNRYMYEGIMHFIEAFEPDVVINDHQLYAGAIAAYKKKIPYATSVTAPAAINAIEELPKIHEWETKQITGLQKELGLDLERSIVCSDLMTLVFTSREFFGEKDLPDYYKFVGPVIQNRSVVPSFDWQKFRQMDNKTRILISIGTTFDHAFKKDFFSKVIEAFKDEPLSAVVVADPSLFEHWPDNFIVQSKVPQVDLLPYMDAVVCHGGHNTVCETLYNGLPLVVIPIAYDQSHVAGRVAHVGCGIRLNFKRFKAEQLNEAIWEIINTPNYRNVAKSIQDSFERAGGTNRAAVLLEELVSVQKPKKSLISR